MFRVIFISDSLYSAQYTIHPRIIHSYATIQAIGPDRVYVASLPLPHYRILRKRPNFNVSGAVQYQSDRTAHGSSERPAPTAAASAAASLYIPTPRRTRLLQARLQNNIYAFICRAATTRTPIHRSRRGERPKERPFWTRMQPGEKEGRSATRSLCLPSVACMRARVASDTMQAGGAFFVVA